MTTIGDRAVAGARKMLGLQNAGTAGLVQMVNDLAEGQLSNQTTTALIQAVRLISSYKVFFFNKSNLSMSSFLIVQGLLVNLDSTTLYPKES